MKLFISLWMSVFFTFSIQAQNELIAFQNTNTLLAFEDTNLLDSEPIWENPSELTAIQLTNDTDDNLYKLFPSEEEIKELLTTAKNESKNSLLVPVRKLDFYTGNDYLNDQKADGKRWSFKSVQFRFKLSAGNDPSQLFNH